MPRIVYDENIFPFVEGEQLNGANLDSCFTKLTDLVNTTKLDKDNLRAFVGITNDQKLTPYSVVPLSFCVPRFATNNSTATWAGVIAYPHYAQYEIAPTDRSPSNGSVTEKVATKPTRTFQIIALEAVFHDHSGLVNPDLIFFDLSFRRQLDGALNKQPGAVSLSVSNNNLLQVFLPAGAGLDAIACDYVSVDMRLSIGVHDVTVYNTICTLWLLMPHVP